MKTNLLKIVNLVNLNGGATYNLVTGETNPDHGYGVAVNGYELRVPFIDNDTLAAYALEHAAILTNEDLFLGIWKDGNEYVIDVTQGIEDKETALITGILRGQLAIWDSANKDEIRLPEPQRAGTETQKREYARIKAKEILSQT